MLAGERKSQSRCERLGLDRTSFHLVIIFFAIFSKCAILSSRDFRTKDLSVYAFSVPMSPVYEGSSAGSVSI